MSTNRRNERLVKMRCIGCKGDLQIVRSLCGAPVKRSIPSEMDSSVWG